MSGTKILLCKCKHPFQDEKYGQGKRVHNTMRKDTKNKWRCTVCGDAKEGTLAGSTSKAKEKGE